LEDPVEDLIPENPLEHKELGKTAFSPFTPIYAPKITTSRTTRHAMASNANG
jgi:hypothetical protein